MKKCVLLLLACVLIGSGETVWANSYDVNDIAFLMLMQREKLNGNRIMAQGDNYIKNLSCHDDNGKYISDYSNAQYRDLYNQYGEKYKFVCIDEKTYLEPKVSYWLENFHYPLSETFRDDLNNPQVEIDINNINKILADNENEEIRAISKTIDVRYLLKEDYKIYNSDGGSFLGTLVYKAEQNKSEYYPLMISNIENYVKHNVPLQLIYPSNEEMAKMTDELKKDISIYNNFKETPLLELSDKIITPAKKTKKEKFKQFAKAVNHYLLEDNTIADIQAEIKAPYIKRQKMLNNYNFKLSQIEQRAFNTAFMTLNTDDNNDKMEQKIKDTDKKADLLYEQFQNNPTNMKNNAELIKIIGTAKGEYTNIINKLTSNVKDMYNIYINSYNLQRKYLNLPEQDGSVNLYYDNPLLDIALFIDRINNRVDVPIYEFMEEKIKKYDEIAKIVSEYSYNYEKQQYQKGLVKNGKKQVKGTLEQFVYASHYQPQVGALYTHHPTNNLFLKVLQTVPGGVILTGTYIGANTYGQNLIFLQTSKSFADGQYIREPLTTEFKGYYDYTTVLGVKKRIYKFYRLGQNEINANFKIPGQIFYFYEP